MLYVLVLFFFFCSSDLQYCSYSLTVADTNTNIQTMNENLYTARQLNISDHVQLAVHLHFIPPVYAVIDLRF